MNYNASVSDFFKSPKWGSNLMLGAVAIIIPIVGPLALGGWHVTGFWAQGDEDNPAKFPPFDFKFFSKYIERGLWPFLVNLVASLVLAPLMMCMVFPLMILPAAFNSSHGHGHGHGLGPAFFLALGGIMILQFVMTIFYQLIVTPLMLKATLTQDFKSAFDIGFMRDFLSRVWKEQFAIMVFMLGVGLCMMIIAIITCYIGMFFAMPVTVYSWHHLQKQLYQLYLSRGGAPVPLSPKLQDLPPPLPPSLPSPMA